MNGIYHICTDGLSSNILFKNETDFIAGMNGIPLCSIATGTSVLCFCLMSNHVHFVIKGNEKNCRDFIIMYKKHMAAKISGLKGTFMKEIGDTEYLKSVIAYVLRNPVAANMRVTPGEYKWSSGNLYFADRSKSCFTSESGFPVRRLGSMKWREIRSIINSHVRLPDDYTVTSDGLILPHNYVDYGFVENIYVSPRQYLYYLAKNDDLENELESGLLRSINYSDTELYSSMTDLCMSIFRKNDPASLTIEEKFKLAILLRKRYGSGTKQVARLTGIDSETLKKIGF